MTVYTLKSKQKGDRMSGNSCEGCDWAMVTMAAKWPTPIGGPQSGCRADRLAKFKARGEATRNSDTGYYDLSRVCTLKRENFEGTLEQAIYQIEPLFGVVIEDSGEGDWEDVVNAADQIISQDYNRKKISVIVSTNATRGMENIVLMTEKFNPMGYGNFKTVIHAANVEQEIKELDQWRPLVAANYFVKIRAGEKPVIKKDFLSSIRDRVVDNLEKIVIEDYTGVTVSLTAAVRATYNNFNSYEKTLEHLRELKGLFNES